MPFLLLALLLCALPCCSQTKTPPPIMALYVAPNGNDANPGTQALPLATLEGARDKIRKLNLNNNFPSTGVMVWLAAGTYERTSSFVLGPADSGDEGAPVVYEAMPGADVRLSGGHLIPPNAFTPVTDPAILNRLDPDTRPHVLQADLKALGLTDYGTLQPRDWGHTLIPSALELYVDDKAMTLARWPNTDFAVTGAVPDPGTATTMPDGSPRTPAVAGGTFVCTEDRESRWTADPDPWIYGYYHWNWAGEYLPIGKIDPTQHTISLGRRHPYGIIPGARYYVFNVLEELDSPGEWYLDRQSGKLYFWPPTPLEGKLVTVSLLSDPIVDMHNCDHVILKGLTIENCRGVGIRILGGLGNEVSDCTIRNAGTAGVQIGTPYQGGDTVQPTHGGFRNGISGCEIMDTGDFAVMLAGGDRKSLDAGDNYVQDCDIHGWGRISRTNATAVEMAGVGNLISHCRIHDAPYVGIHFWGNNEVIEYNEVYNVCMEADDAGALYIGRDWSMRGNLIRGNYIHDIGRFAQGKNAVGTCGIYLDDFSSGTQIEGNIVTNAGIGILVGGGRDNTVNNNIFSNCSTCAIHFDARGTSWNKKFIDGTDDTLTSRLKAVNYTQPPYSTRYPELPGILSDDPGIPKGNVFRGNICVGDHWIAYYDKMDNHVALDQDNLVKGDVGLVDPTHGDFSLVKGGPAEKMGFPPIKLGDIGPRTKVGAAN